MWKTARKFVRAASPWLLFGLIVSLGLMAVLHLEHLWTRVTLFLVVLGVAGGTASLLADYWTD
jgi:uncharacterized protein YqhQ